MGPGEGEPPKDPAPSVYGLEREVVRMAGTRQKQDDPKPFFLHPSIPGSCGKGAMGRADIESYGCSSSEMLLSG